MNPIESILVGNRQVDPFAFVVPEMRLSSGRADADCHQVTVAINLDGMIDYLSPQYEEWAFESKTDDEQIGKPFDALAIAGYPSLRDLTLRPDILGDVLGHYLLHGFIGQLTWNGSQPIQYWLDQFSHCEVAGRTVYLHGTCYSKRVSGV